MPTAVIIPQLGESVVEGTVNRWLKRPGETVAKLEPLLEIATDKIDTEVPSPIDGTLLHVLVPEGETVAAGATLAYVGTPGEALPDHGSAVTAAETLQAGSDDRGESESVGDDAQSLAKSRRSGRAFISPVVARIAAEEGIDLADVPGTGLAGRITKKDLLRYVEEESTAQTDSPDAQRQSIDSTDDSTYQPLTTMRRAIAEHMVRSKATSPHVTTVHEVDMTLVVRHREAHKAALAAKGITLTYTAYFMQAAIAGLKAVPSINGRFVEDGIRLNRRIHLGVAVALAQGLVVPVVRDADERNLAGLARAVNALAGQARQGKLTADQLQGGTFTLTNHGIGGSLISTPIINQPQTAILGVGAIVKRPVVRTASSSLLPDADDAIVIRPMCYLSLSFDHRAVDGAQADEFLQVVKETLEEWTEREG